MLDLDRRMAVFVASHVRPLVHQQPVGVAALGDQNVLGAELTRFGMDKTLFVIRRYR